MLIPKIPPVKFWKLKKVFLRQMIQLKYTLFLNNPERPIFVEKLIKFNFSGELTF
jgi:hypothetical protein